MNKMNVKKYLLLFETVILTHVDVKLDRGIVLLHEEKFPVAGYRRVNVVAPIRIPFDMTVKNSGYMFDFLDRLKTALNQTGLANYHSNLTESKVQCRSGDFAECNLGSPALKFGNYFNCSGKKCF